MGNLPTALSLCIVAQTVMAPAAFLSALALWLAENIGTATGTWIYSGQATGQMVSFAKLGSWYLLLYVAFVTVTLVSRSALSATPCEPGPAGASQTLAKS